MCASPDGSDQAAPGSRDTAAKGGLFRTITVLGRMTPGEYRANIEGLNLFFGAVLGVVMATTDRLGAKDFAVTLLLTAGVVVTILYVTHGRHRLAYALLGLIFAAALPQMLRDLLSDPTGVPPHLQPTLLVWIGYVILVEFAPRTDT